MALEVATTIAGLVATNPASGDPVSQADDHLRLLKTVLKGTPFVVDRAYGEYTANANLTTLIPLDDTIPQNTEGTEIISVSITPKSTTNRLRVYFEGQATSSVAPNNVSAAVFSSASANALAACHVAIPSIDFGESLACAFEYVPATTSALTISVRVGPSLAANVRFNGNTGGRFFGGVARAVLIVEEIQV
jgi:hypothetical protein